MTDQDKPGDDAVTNSAPVPAAPAEDDVPENEMMRETRQLRDQEKAAEKAEAARKSGRGWKTAAGIGIGSAALLAAVLFANRDKD